MDTFGYEPLLHMLPWELHMQIISACTYGARGQLSCSCQMWHNLISQEGLSIMPRSGLAAVLEDIEMGVVQLAATIVTIDDLAQSGSFPHTLKAGAFFETRAARMAILRDPVANGGFSWEMAILDATCVAQVQANLLEESCPWRLLRVQGPRRTMEYANLSRCLDVGLIASDSEMAAVEEALRTKGLLARACPRLFSTCLRSSTGAHFRMCAVLGHNVLQVCDRVELGLQYLRTSEAPHLQHRGRIGQVWLLAPLAIRIFGAEPIVRFFDLLYDTLSGDVQEQVLALIRHVEARSHDSLRDLGQQLARAADVTGQWSDVARRLTEMVWALASVVYIACDFNLTATWRIFRCAFALPDAPLSEEDATDADSSAQRLAAVLVMD